MRCGEFGVKLSINIHLKLIHVATLTVLIKMFYTTIVFKPITELFFNCPPYDKKLSVLSAPNHDVK